MSTSRDWKEARRLRAYELKQRGWSQQQIAAALGVTQGAVSQWIKAAQAGGVEALQARPRPGRPPKLRAEWRDRIPTLLERGAEAFGFRGEVWVSARVAEVVRREFGVAYSPSHMTRLLKGLGWTPQKPVVRARQRDEAAVAQWRKTTWRGLKKRPAGSAERRFS